MAHPDDAEVTCAGTLVRLKQEAGCEIIIATSTSGDVGTMSHPPEEIARIRHGEAVRSAGLIDAEYYSGGSKDLLVMYDEPTLLRFVEVVRKARPDIIITQPPVDYMVDHETTSRLVRSAAFGAPAPNVMTFDPDPAPPLKQIPYLYYADPIDEPQSSGPAHENRFIVDISDTMALKEKMLATHESQRKWLKEHHDFEYIDMMKNWCALRGKLIDTAYGEGFTQVRTQPYPPDNIIAKLLKMK